MDIGKKVKEIRKAQKMTLVELSQKSGVQIATLSRMENGRMTGTLESHMAIAKALGVDILKLYSGLTESTGSIEAGTPKDTNIFRHNEKAGYEILTQKLMTKKMMPVLWQLEPEGKTNIEEHTPGAEKFIFVVEGKIEAYIGDEVVSLSKNNCLYFDSSLRHYFVNLGKVPAKVLSVGTPVML